MHKRVEFVIGMKLPGGRQRSSERRNVCDALIDSRRMLATFCDPIVEIAKLQASDRRLQLRQAIIAAKAIIAVPDVAWYFATKDFVTLRSS